MRGGSQNAVPAVYRSYLRDSFFVARVASWKIQKEEIQRVSRESSVRLGERRGEERERRGNGGPSLRTVWRRP
jgi:hypothetical protein